MAQGVGCTTLNTCSLTGRSEGILDLSYPLTEPTRVGVGKNIGRIHRLPGLLSLAIQQYLTSIPVKGHGSGFFGFRVFCFQSYTVVMQIYAIPFKTQQLSTTSTRM